MIKQTLLKGLEGARGQLAENMPTAPQAINNKPINVRSEARTKRATAFFRVAARVIPVIILAFMLLAAPSASYAHVSIGIAVTTVEPPPLVVYDQPYCPGPNFIWTPGYWAWGPDGYFWVPGTWVLAPYSGELWTPGYWAWDDDDDAYYWNPGYWGPEVGFYGGIVYGFGYYGSGYQGGYWRGGTFFYNTAVNQVNTTTVTNVYNRTVINNTTVTNVSYNGGTGGTTVRPTAVEIAASHAQHHPAVAAQSQQEQLARSNRAQYAAVNHGAPTVAATAKPTAFSGPGVVRARAGSQPAVAVNRSTANRVIPRNNNGGAVTRPANPPRSNANVPPPAQPKRQAEPPQKPRRPHSTEPPRQTTLRREAPPQRPTGPPERMMPRHENNTRPVAMQRTTPPPARNIPHAAPPQRSIPRVAPSRNPAPPQNAQHRGEPRPPKGGR